MKTGTLLLTFAVIAFSHTAYGHGGSQARTSVKPKTEYYQNVNGTLVKVPASSVNLELIDSGIEFYRYDQTTKGLIRISAGPCLTADELCL